MTDKVQRTRQRMKAAGVYRYEVAQELNRTPATISVWLKEGNEFNLALIDGAVREIKMRRRRNGVGNLQTSGLSKEMYRSAQV